MTAQVGIWAVGNGAPQRAERSGLRLEFELEDWAANDPSLLVEGLRVVGRQLHVPGGFLDLLGLDVQGRWVVIELKRDRLYREVIAQALDYTACIRDLAPSELRHLISAGISRLPNSDGVMSAVDAQLDGETDGVRDVAIIVAGAGIDPGLERVTGLLAQFELPIRVVSFDVFQLPERRQLLVREVVEEEDENPGHVTPQRRTVQDISALAKRAGVQKAFDQIVAAAESAGLFARPYTRSVMITPATHRNRFLIVLTPYEGRGLRESHGVEAFVEFFPDLAPREVEAILGPSNTDRILTGDTLDRQAEVISRFLGDLPGGEENDRRGSAGGRRDEQPIE